jgi:HKD family nuclease
MELLSNQGKRNHRKRIVDLISKSDEIILCSGWLSHPGLKKILPALITAKQDNHASITIYSNKKHTNQECIDSLGEFKHIVVDDSIKYLHTKLYYFKSDSTYTALIGSVNLTLGGLINNDELSVEITGSIGDQNHSIISPILEHLNSYSVM